MQSLKDREQPCSGLFLTVQLNLESGSWLSLPPADLGLVSRPQTKESPCLREQGHSCHISVPLSHDAHSVLKEQGGDEYSPVGEEAPGEGPQQDPGHEDGLALGLQALVVTHQTPLEEKEGATTWLSAQGLAGPGWQREVQVGSFQSRTHPPRFPRSRGPGSRGGRGVLAVASTRGQQPGMNVTGLCIWQGDGHSEWTVVGSSGR